MHLDDGSYIPIGGKIGALPEPLHRLRKIILGNLVGMLKTWIQPHHSAADCRREIKITFPFLQLGFIFILCIASEIPCKQREIGWRKAVAFKQAFYLFRPFPGYPAVLQFADAPNFNAFIANGSRIF
nr:hypothetical protein [Paenibacillus arenilitoris]